MHNPHIMQKAVRRYIERLAGRMVFILIAASSIWSTMSFAQVGVLVYGEGSVLAGPRANPTEVTKGKSIAVGDFVKTGVNAWALFKMADGAIVTVRPDSEIVIRDYRFQASGEATGHASKLELLKGALRVVTGLIGQKNPAGYAILTQTATIGIRGTDHETAFLDAERGVALKTAAGTYEKVSSGVTMIRNERGEVRVEAGQFAFAPAEAHEPPRRLEREPVFMREYTRLDQRIRPQMQRLIRENDESRRQQSGSDQRGDVDSGRSSSRSDRSERATDGVRSNDGGSLRRDDTGISHGRNR